jgi:hypothetical protein
MSRGAVESGKDDRSRDGNKLERESRVRVLFRNTSMSEKNESHGA